MRALILFWKLSHHYYNKNTDSSKYISLHVNKSTPATANNKYNKFPLSSSLDILPQKPAKVH